MTFIIHRLPLDKTHTTFSSDGIEYDYPGIVTKDFAVSKQDDVSQISAEVVKFLQELQAQELMVLGNFAKIDESNLNRFSVSKRVHSLGKNKYQYTLEYKLFSLKGGEVLLTAAINMYDDEELVLFIQFKNKTEIVKTEQGCADLDATFNYRSSRDESYKEINFPILNKPPVVEITTKLEEQLNTLDVTLG